MLQFINKTLISQLTTDSELFKKVERRVYPKYIDLQEENLLYPLVTFVTLGGVPDVDGYPVDNYLLDFRYISSENIQESWILYKRIHGIINRKNYLSSNNLQSFYIKEDSKPMDATEIIGGRTSYILTNTYEFKCVGEVLWGENTPVIIPGSTERFARYYNETFTATSTKTVTHNFKTTYVTVTVYNSSGAILNTGVTIVNANSIQLTFAGTLTNATVVITG